MFWDTLVRDIQPFFLIFARVFALLQTAPLLSSSGVPSIARVGLALLTSFVIFPWAQNTLPNNADQGLYFVLYLIAEILIGILMGLFLQIVVAGFQTAGQFFSLQMGFGASQVFDPLAQTEIPLMGQFFNLMAMLVFLSTGGFHKVFFVGIYEGFQSVQAIKLVHATDDFLPIFIGALGNMFRQALTLAFPVFGTLFLVSISMGLLAKAAPQMNLLMLGFPLAIIVAFLVLLILIPILMETFEALLDNTFSMFRDFFMRINGSAEALEVGP